MINIHRIVLITCIALRNYTNQNVALYNEIGLSDIDNSMLLN